MTYDFDIHIRSSIFALAIIYANNFLVILICFFNLNLKYIKLKKITVYVYTFNAVL